MNYFCTLSDINYVAKGLALYKSLRDKSRDPFELHYLCLDQRSYDVLIDLNFSEIIPYYLPFIEQDNDDLTQAKSNRNYIEYCWTLASYFSLYVLKNNRMDHIIYLDSDIYFFQDPDIIYKEIGNKSIGIITNRIDVGWGNGAYNVGLVYFNKIGNDCLSWWSDAVLNQISNYFGCRDQKYLEGFIPKFGAENVCIIDETVGHGAPWNFKFYNYEIFKDTGRIIWNNKKQLLVFVHFSRFSYDLNTDVIDFASDHHSDHTLQGKIFNVPEITEIYKNYYKELKYVHETWLSDKETKTSMKMIYGY